MKNISGEEKLFSYRRCSGENLLIHDKFPGLQQRRDREIHHGRKDSSGGKSKGWELCQRASLASCVKDK